MGVNSRIWRMAHDGQVDDSLVQLIALLISIRYVPWAMVELEWISPSPRGLFEFSTEFF
jgi:hypothetical protein